MAEEVWTLEVFEFLDGEGVGKIIANEPVFAELDVARQTVRQRMASIVEHGQPGDAIRLIGQKGELYRWTRQEHALATAKLQETEDRRPGKNNA